MPVMDPSFTRFLCALLALNAAGITGTVLLLLRTEMSAKVLVYDRVTSAELTVQCQLDKDTEVQRIKNVTKQVLGMANETRPQGYIVAMKHYEQQTQGLKNYLQLQCLADSYGMRTVEPFLERSFLTIPTEKLAQGKRVTVLGDLIDVDLWNKEVSTKFGYQPMSSWNEFLHSAPRNLVIGCIRQQNPPDLHVPLPGSDYKLGCPKDCFSALDPTVHFLERFGFTVVREACANFYDYAGSVTTEDFLENLLRDQHKPQETTILLNQFRGFFGLYRLPLLSNCGIKHHRMNVSVMPSPQIMKDAQEYIDHFFGDNRYIAILVRLERLVVHLHQNITTCTADLLTILNELHSERNLPRKYFLAMDVGEYGSQASARSHLLPYGKRVFQSIYNDTCSFKEWEGSFASFAASNMHVDSGGDIVNDDAGYIANIQRVVAAKSDCLIMFGGGGFQAQTREYYDLYHHDPKSYCLRKLCGREAMGRDPGSRITI